MSAFLKIKTSLISEDGLVLRYKDTAENLGVQIDESDLKIVSPLKIWIEIKKISNKMIVRGTVFTSIELICSRCLSSYNQVISEKFSISYQKFDGSLPKELELNEDSISIVPFEGEEIDLGEQVRESLILALPIQPLCQKDCKGLCPYCGENRNIKECACEIRKIDPRLLKLKKLL